MQTPDTLFGEVLEDHLELLRRVGEEMGTVSTAAAELMIRSLRDGGRVLVCGNGGSAADSQHFAAELVGRFGRDGSPLAAMALTVDSSILTALGNDRDFAEIFACQVEALGRPGDVLVVITTSGASPNVLRAVEEAGRRGLQVIGLTGANGREPLASVDCLLAVPSTDTQRIQEMHSMLLHIVGEIVVREVE